MIKINLKKTKTSSVHHKTDLDDSEKMDYQTAMNTIVKDWFKVDFEQLNPFLLVSMLFKLTVMACFPLGLYIYEVQIINQLKDEFKIVDQKKQSKEKTLKELQAQIAGQEYLKDKAKEYDSKKEFLKGVANSRIIIPQLLDQVQSIIPESVWLKSIQVSIKKEGKLTIKGESLGEDRINLFANSLETIVKRESIKVNMNDIKENNNSVKVGFTLKASLLNRRNF
ncbi:MAG: PilN domain-containing protein [Bdellovibrionales bacterium]